MTSNARWSVSVGLSITMSTSALASISTTGSSTVATVAPKPGRFSRSSDGRCGTIRSGAWMSTQRAAYREKTGPAMITVGMATRTPSASVTPRLACTAAMATSGPGCGGISPCITDRLTSAGIPIRISEKLPRLATSRTTGISSTMPISKKSGSPTIAAISTIAHGIPRRLRLREDGVDDLVGAAGVREELAEYGAERDQDTHARGGGTEARGETGDDLVERSTRDRSQDERSDGQRQERVELGLRDEQDDDGDAREDGDPQLGMVGRRYRRYVRCQHLDTETGHGGFLRFVRKWFVRR